MKPYITAILVTVASAFTAGAVSTVDYLQGDARLDISYDEHGVKRASIGFKVEIRDVEAFTKGFAEWFGVHPSQVMVAENVEGLTLIAGARSQLAGNSPFVYSDTLITHELQRALEAAGAQTLHVVAFLPPSPIARIGTLQGINLMGILRHEVTVSVESLTEEWPVRFGWRYRDLTIYIATPVVFLFLFELALRYLRRRVMVAQGLDRPAAIFACGKAHHIAIFVFLVLWTGLILLIVPTSYLLYLPQGYETLGLTLTVVGPLLIAAAYTIWIRAALYPVFRQFPEPNWSRRELIAQGGAISLLCVCLSVFFAGGVLMRIFDRLDGIDKLTLFPIAAAITPAIVIMIYSRFLGTVVRTPQTDSETKRYEELARWRGLNDAPPLVLVYRLRSRLAAAIEQFISLHAMRVRRQSAIFVEARLLRESEPDELDVILLTEIDKLKHPDWKRLRAVRVIYKGLMFPGIPFALLITSGISAATGAEWGKLAYNGWVLFLLVYMLPFLLLLVGRWHQARLARQCAHKTDERVLEQLGEPEAHIRALFRQARVDCVPLDTPRWLRSLTTPSPMERVRHLAEQSAISDGRIQTLLSHIDDTIEQTSSDPDSRLVADIDRLLLKINLLRALPILVFVFFPMLIAWTYHRFLDATVPVSVFVPVAISVCAIAVIWNEYAAGRFGKRRLLEILQYTVNFHERTDIEPMFVRVSRVRQFHQIHTATMDGAGILFYAGDTLCYRNEDIDLELHATRIEQITMKLEPMAFLPVFSIRISWREGELSPRKEYRIQFLNPGTDHAVNLDTVALYFRLFEWWKRDAEKSARLASDRRRLKNLNVELPWSHWNSAKCAGTTVGIGIVCSVLGFYIGWDMGLPMNWSDSNSAFITPAIYLGITASIAAIEWIYLRRFACRFSEFSTTESSEA